MAKEKTKEIKPSKEVEAHIKVHEEIAEYNQKRLAAEAKEHEKYL